MKTFRFLMDRQKVDNFHTFILFTRCHLEVSTTIDDDGIGDWTTHRYVNTRHNIPFAPHWCTCNHPSHRQSLHVHPRQWHRCVRNNLRCLSVHWVVFPLYWKCWSSLYFYFVENDGHTCAASVQNFELEFLKLLF